MFEEVAFRTPVGETSPVFETIYGFNIIRVTEKAFDDFADSGVDRAALRKMMGIG